MIIGQQKPIEIRIARATPQKQWEIIRKSPEIRNNKTKLIAHFSIDINYSLGKARYLK